MAWPMIEWVLDRQFADLHHRERRGERSLLLYEVPESAATPLMESVEAEFPDIRVFSLPSVGEGGQRRHIELGVKGPLSLLDAAWARLEAGARARRAGRADRAGQLRRPVWQSSRRLPSPLFDRRSADPNDHLVRLIGAAHTDRP